MPKNRKWCISLTTKV